MDNFKINTAILLIFIAVVLVLSVFLLNGEKIMDSTATAFNKFLGGAVPVPSCTVNSDCGYGQICKNGLCAGGSLAIVGGSNGGGSTTPPACESGTYWCPDGKICASDGYCYPTIGASCEDLQCAPPLICCTDASSGSHCDVPENCGKTQCSDSRQTTCITQNKWGTCQNGVCNPKPPSGSGNCGKITCDVCNKCDIKTGKCGADPVACDPKNPYVCYVNGATGYCVNEGGMGVCKTCKDLTCPADTVCPVK